MRVFCIAIEPVAVIVHYIERNDQSDCKKKSINRRKLLQTGCKLFAFFFTNGNRNGGRMFASCFAVLYDNNKSAL